MKFTIVMFNKINQDEKRKPNVLCFYSYVESGPKIIIIVLIIIIMIIRHEYGSGKSSGVGEGRKRKSRTEKES